MKSDRVKNRCKWCLGDPIYEKYHDQEWGVPVMTDNLLFEYLILETMQAGLSWITILKKRENYRQALDNFNIQKIADYDAVKKEQLLHNAGIIRHRLKINSIVTNAQAFINVQNEHGSFSRFIWSFVDHQPLINSWNDAQEVPSKTLLSDRIAKELKQLGFKFVGSTVVYAFMQATGMVNDHLTSCYRYDEV